VPDCGSGAGDQEATGLFRPLRDHRPKIGRQRRSATIGIWMHQLDERELVGGYAVSRVTIYRVLGDEDLSTAPT
jgi:hypothetical protein